MVPVHDMASGIDGKVILRPVTPVEQPGTINQRPYEAIITVETATGRVVASVRSDSAGRFRIILEPGTYVLHPASEAIYPHAPAQTVTVTQDQFTPVRIVYDSGIR
ncbi:hypothetical protein ACI48D_23870 [Massilia sp. LXY-6]|uniref:hypothetical protein n=1 Tax=Massilia sp. LXY-6 TaxID=3379823 RepID=UPI003EE30E98